MDSTKPSPNDHQTNWIKKLETCFNFGEFELIVSDIILSMQFKDCNQNYNVQPEIDNFYGFKNKPNKFTEHVCSIELSTIQHYYKNILKKNDHPLTEKPICIPNINLKKFPEDPLSELFQREEVDFKLRERKPTCSGPDGITFEKLSQFDPGSFILTQIFNKCIFFKKIPQNWKKFYTVLKYKAGDEKNLKNWRPINLINTIPRLYATCISDRLTKWSLVNKILSPEQKGFVNMEKGRSEHNFVLQTIIEDVQMNDDKEVYMCFMDFENAFGSLSHEIIIEVLKLIGLTPDTFTFSIITDFIQNNSTQIVTDLGRTDEISCEKGLPQGCALSNILFDLALEPLVRCINSQNIGYNLNNRNVSCMLFVDDTVLISSNVEGIEQLFNSYIKVADWLGFKMNLSKCASLCIDGRNGGSVVEKQFIYRNENFTMIREGEFNKFLGAKVGFNCKQSYYWKTIVKSLKVLQSEDEYVLSLAMKTLSKEAEGVTELDCVQYLNDKTIDDTDDDSIWKRTRLALKGIGYGNLKWIYDSERGFGIEINSENKSIDELIKFFET